MIEMAMLAPFTKLEVKEINDYQKSGKIPYFTCLCEGHPKLVAEQDGLVCPHCGYIQKWIYNWIPDGSWRNRK
jgi:hypothetical protein